MMSQGKYLPPPEANYKNFSSSDMLPSTFAKKKNKERFNDEQVKCLESVFRVTRKIEPRKKVQVAKEIGLQPRQVGIWFQNKRARWKSKQMEKDYSALKARYASLASQYETLKKEKQYLDVQLEHLSNQLQEQEEKGKEANYLAQGVINEDSKKMAANNLYELMYTGKEEMHQLLLQDGQDTDKFQALPESWYKLGGRDISDVQIWDF